LCSCHAFIRGQKLRDAAQALCDRWDTPLWKDAPHTGEYIAALREALREDALVCLSETHQQLGEVGPKIGEQLGEEYELIGTLDGTYGGRWTLSAFAENWSTAWPDGTAVYVRRRVKPTLNQATSTMWEMMNLNDEWQARLEAAVAAEREACAKVVENYAGAWDDQGYALSQAIRARGQ